MLYCKKTDLPFDKDAIIDELHNLQRKSLHLEHKYADNANSTLAPSCRQYAKILEECADLVAKMLPPRGAYKTKIFADNTKESLRKTRDILQECESAEYPIKNGTVEKIINDLRSLLFETI